MSDQAPVTDEAASAPAGDSVVVEGDVKAGDTVVVTSDAQPAPAADAGAGGDADAQAAAKAADAAALEQATRDEEDKAAEDAALLGAGAPEGAALPVDGEPAAEHPEPTPLAFVHQDNVTEPGVQVTRAPSQATGTVEENRHVADGDVVPGERSSGLAATGFAEE